MKDTELTFFQSIEDSLKKNEELFNSIKSEYYDEIVIFITKTPDLFINDMKEKGISNENSNEFYSSDADLINKFLDFFYEFFIKKKTWFSPKSTEIDYEENQPLLSGPLSGEQNLNHKDILFLRLTYMCALLFNHLSIEFKIEDISSKILDKIYKNTSDELRNLSPVKDIVLPNLDITISFDDKKETFSLSDLLQFLKIGRHIDNDFSISKGKNYYCSRFHAILFYYINKFGSPTIALIDPGSLLGIKEKYSYGFSSRKPVFYFDFKSSDRTFKMGDFEVKISLQLIENN